MGQRGVWFAEHLELAEAASRCQAWRARGERVVLTNGCFDLLHPGHVHTLATARALGDHLIVAINDDSAVRALKGPGRPLMPLAARVDLVCALRAVEIVVAFSGLSAESVLRALQPDVYAKGGDYDPYRHRPAEASLALAMGAAVAYLPRVAPWSTSQLIGRLREASP